MREADARRRPARQVQSGKPPRPTRADAELRAAALIAGAKLTKPPTDLQLVGELLGIHEISERRMTKSAMLVAIPGGIHGIVVNSADSRVRRRFSIAHEYGHLALERTYALRELAPVAHRGAANELEHVVDYFAACLLMPSVWVGDAWRSGLQDERSIARHFDVSVLAAAARLRELAHQGA